MATRCFNNYLLNSKSVKQCHITRTETVLYCIQSVDGIMNPKCIPRDSYFHRDLYIGVNFLETFVRNMELNDLRKIICLRNHEVYVLKKSVFKIIEKTVSAILLYK